MTFKGYLGTSMFWVNLLFVSSYECLYHPQSSSLMPPRWKIYSQVSSRKKLGSFIFSPVRQAVPTGVLRQGVYSKTCTMKFITYSLCIEYKVLVKAQEALDQLLVYWKILVSRNSLEVHNVRFLIFFIKLLSTPE